jgi:hypothetical protein
VQQALAVGRRKFETGELEAFDQGLKREGDM